MITSPIFEAQRRQLLRDPLHLLSIGLGAGLSPWAPGTIGTLLAVPVAWACADLSLSWYLFGVVTTVVVGVGLCGRTARLLNAHDHPAIVFDEIAAYLLTVALVPKTWVWLGAGFVLFRIFDVLKPPPIHWLDQHIHGGFGIMLDDVAAALYAMLALLLAQQLF